MKRNNWEKQKEWHGNPSLGFDSYMRTFINPHNKKRVPVYIFGKGNNWSFSVSAGANSEFSYTGGFPADIKRDIETLQWYILKTAMDGKLFK